MTFAILNEDDAPPDREILVFHQCADLWQQTYDFNFKYSEPFNKYCSLLCKYPASTHEITEIIKFYGQKKIYKVFSLQNIFKFYTNEDSIYSTDDLYNLLYAFIILKRLHFLEDFMYKYNNDNYSNMVDSFIKSQNKILLNRFTAFYKRYNIIYNF
tara:strand:+ start:2948 stop:3415 length:468 start_codon:yes stop_codon:yes gene_type:complete